MLYFGTSGFAYADWVGPFYPPGMPKRDWLPHYARHFNAVELEGTYHTIPSPQTVASLARQTPNGFMFVVKAHQDMMNTRQNNDHVFAAFLRGIQPLREACKLGGILAQFPHSFGISRQNMDYLERFGEKVPDLPLVVEFRSNQWVKPSVFQWLRQEGLGFCCVDGPPMPELMPPIAEVTGPVAYVRLDGRNSLKWWRHDHVHERYDYTYASSELTEWAPRIRALTRTARRTFVFANSYCRAQSINTILCLRSMLQ